MSRIQIIYCRISGNPVDAEPLLVIPAWRSGRQLRDRHGHFDPYSSLCVNGSMTEHPMAQNGEHRVDHAEQPFETIESAHEFMVLLENVIAEARHELEALLADASDERRTEALRLALFKISQLDVHTRKSRRVLNDLGLIRSVLVRG
ncbi:MAG TPA: hypothetical protein VME17_20840 [Bryobacteraceae bacterium]|nr:hypothetical protein [Bryobacteraceae bacterium]